MLLKALHGKHKDKILTNAVFELIANFKLVGNILIDFQCRNIHIVNI